MGSWKLSDPHKKVFVVKKLNVELMLVIVVFEFGEEFMTRVRWRQNPRINEDMSYVSYSWRFGTKMM